MKELAIFSELLLITLGIIFVGTIFLFVSESFFKKTTPKLLAKAMGLAFSSLLLTGNALAIYVILLAWLPLGWWIIAGTLIFTLLLALWTVAVGKKFEHEEWEKEQSYVVLLIIILLATGVMAMISIIAQHAKLLMFN